MWNSQTVQASVDIDTARAFIFVPTGSESALKIVALARSIEKNTESRLLSTFLSSLSENALTATPE